MTFTPNDQLAAHFAATSVVNIRHVLDAYLAQPAFQRLEHDLSGAAFDLPAVIENGLALLAEKTRANSAASSYFFVLSELVEIPEDVRDFFLDVSVYADGAFGRNEHYKSFDPISDYHEKIAPLLLRPAEH